MDAFITPTRPEHIESFHRALDIVARERKYLALLEAPPLAETREFVMDLILSGRVAGRSAAGARKLTEMSAT